MCLISQITYNILIPKIKYTYGSTGKKGAGPTRRKLLIISKLPAITNFLGYTLVSHILPTMGAVNAYIPPLIMKTNPTEIGLNWN